MRFFGGVVATLLLAFGLLLVLAASRIDSEAELRFIQRADVVVGLVMAYAMLVLVRCSGALDETAIRPRAGLGAFLVLWGVASGVLIAWHEAVARSRWYVPPAVWALNGATEIAVACGDYARDCGDAPPPAQGLAGLVSDPGVAGWSGPYLGSDRLTDPWGRPYQYRAEANSDRILVWSMGPDGRSGTSDDVRREVLLRGEAE
ncbi:type II secretion system protein GspG [Paludisphaera soli]|uniref:type II secretion system protein GspG n=1 Tax=Paludisphaera soli TaxID=2712865 RepID=UPI00197CD937|nr:type II secretion system protein GspG [Paludisphaera soli]